MPPSIPQTDPVHDSGAVFKPLPDVLERRLTDLEIKASYAEDQIDQLNMVIYRQQQQVDALVRELAQLRQMQAEQGAGPARSLRDELPPHY